MSAVVQRWEERRSRFRPAGEVIRTREYDVAELPDDTTPKAFVEAHHYSGSYPAARFRAGLYRHGNLVGTAVFSHPASDKVLTNVFAVSALEAVELGRFVLLDEVPGNGETWFLARAFDLIRRRGIRGVVSFSDPIPRATSEGETVFAGHIGTIYQAHNGAFLGRGRPRTLRLLPDARVMSARALSKIRAGSKGWRYSAELLEAHGADRCPDEHDARQEWLRTWLRRLTRPLRHPGNFRYAWAVDRRLRPQLSERQPYPKLTTTHHDAVC